MQTQNLSGSRQLSQDECQFLKGSAERRTLAGGRLQAQCGSPLRNEVADGVKTRHDFLESSLDAAAHVRARMQHEKGKAKLVCPHEFLA